METGKKNANLEQYKTDKEAAEKDCLSKKGTRSTKKTDAYALLFASAWPVHYSKLAFPCPS